MSNIGTGKDSVLCNTPDGPQWVSEELLEWREHIANVVISKMNTLFMSDDFKIPYDLTDEECEQYAKELVEKLIAHHKV